MIATKEAITAGLTRACADGLVGIGRGGSPSALQIRYCRQSIPLDPSEDGLWIIPPFDPELARVQGDEETAEADGWAGEPSVTGESSEIAAGEETDGKGAVQRFVVQGEVPVESWSELFRCFVGPAARMNLKKLGLGVQFEMVLPEDGTLSENDSAFKAMKEAARQLGLTLTIEK